MQNKHFLFILLYNINVFFALECLAQLHGTGMAYALSHANSSQEKTVQSLTGKHH
jgi:hypothetical protein